MLLGGERFIASEGGLTGGIKRREKVTYESSGLEKATGKGGNRK